MRRIEELDLLFQSVLNRFFLIRAHQPVSGAVTFAQMRVLWALEMEKAPVLGTVSRMLGISNSTATELVDRLVRGGYARREQSAKDRRQVILTLRPKGRAMLADFAKRRLERFRRLARVVGAGDIERMGRALETMNAILGKWYGKKR